MTNKVVDFEHLPDTLKYGIVIFPDLKIGIINQVMGHDALIEEYTNDAGIYELEDKGLLTGVVIDSIIIVREKGTSGTQKLIKDVAEYYNMSVIFERRYN
jgi:hypothetical protein